MAGVVLTVLIKTLYLTSPTLLLVKNFLKATTTATPSMKSMALYSINPHHRLSIHTILPLILHSIPFVKRIIHCPLWKKRTPVCLGKSLRIWSCKPHAKRSQHNPLKCQFSTWERVWKERTGQRSFRGNPPRI